MAVWLSLLFVDCSHQAVILITKAAKEKKMNTENLVCMMGMPKLQGSSIPMPETTSPMEPNTDCELLNVTQVCEALKVGRSTLYKLVNSKSLPAVKLLGRTLFRPNDVTGYIASLNAFEGPPNGS